MKKLKYLAAAILMTVLPFTAKAQNSVTLRGSVTEVGSNASLAYSTVALYLADSTLCNGTTADADGLFEIGNVKHGKYRIEVSLMGYKTAYKMIEAGKDSGNLQFALELDAEMLESSKVTAKVPVIEMKVDKIVMNVANAVSTQGSTAKDVLRKAPGVSIDKDGNVKLNGQSVSVWIDGRPSHLSGKDLEAFLTATDGTAIDKIEVMAHPSAKYDAQGSGGIIDIKMKRNLLKGFNGSVNGNFGGMYFDEEKFGSHFDHNGGGSVTLGYRTDKINTTASYREHRDKEAMFVSSDSFLDDITLNSEGLYTDHSYSRRAKVSTDWFIDKKNTVGAIVTASLSDSPMGTPEGNSLIDTYFGETLKFRQQSFTNNDEKSKNLVANLNYTHVFDEAKSQEITINADYAVFYKNNTSDQRNIYLDLGYSGEVLPADNIFKTDGNQNVIMYSAKADYQQMILQKGMLEAGAKFVTTTTANDNLREDFINGAWKKNDNYSSLFDYRESVAAVYASASYMFSPKFSMKAGLRGEYTYAKGDWKSAGEKSELSYFKVFPTVFAGYNVSQNLMMSLSYNYRIGRPSYSQLNPQKVYVDATTNMEGNPKIQPQYTHNLTFNTVFKQHFSLALLYQRTTGFIMQAPLVNYAASGTNSIKWDNFGTMTIAGGAFSISEYPVSKWMYFTANIVDAYTVNTDYSGNYNKKGNMLNGYSEMTFVLPKDWKIELGIYFSGRMNFGYLTVLPMLSTWSGVKKEVLDGKGTIALNFNDMFRTERSDVEMWSGNKMVSVMKQKFNRQKINISFSYRFGNVKSVKKRNVGNLEEASRASSGGGTGINTGNSSAR